MSPFRKEPMIRPFLYQLRSAVAPLGWEKPEEAWEEAVMPIPEIKVETKYSRSANAASVRHESKYYLTFANWYTNEHDDPERQSRYAQLLSDFAHGERLADLSALRIELRHELDEISCWAGGLAFSFRRSLLAPLACLVVEAALRMSGKLDVRKQLDVAVGNYDADLSKPSLWSEHAGPWWTEDLAQALSAPEVQSRYAEIVRMMGPDGYCPYLNPGAWGEDLSVLARHAAHHSEVYFRRAAALCERLNLAEYVLSALRLGEAPPPELPARVRNPEGSVWEYRGGCIHWHEGAQLLGAVLCEIDRLRGRESRGRKWTEPYASRFELDRGKWSSVAQEAAQIKRNGVPNGIVVARAEEIAAKLWNDLGYLLRGVD